jgi:PAS domain S-box-containing protein
MPEMNPFVRVYNRLKQCGVQPEMYYHVANHVSFVNKGAIIVGLSALIFSIYSLILPAYEIVLIETVSIILSLSSLAANRLGHYKWARLQLFLLINIILILKSCLLGKESNSHYLFFPVILTSILIYNSKERVLSNFLLVLPILSALFLDLTDFSLLNEIPLSPKILSFTRLLNFSSAVVLLIIITFIFQRTAAKQTWSLNKAKKKLKAIFDNSYDAIFTVDGDTFSIIDCNHRSAELFDNQSPEDMVGENIFTLLAYKLTSKEHHKLHREVNKYSRFSQEYEFTTPKGRVFWGNMAVTTFDVDDNTFFLVRITDVTLKKEQEEKLRSKEAALSEAQKLARMGSFEYDVSTETSIVSEELKIILGFTKDEEVTGDTYVNSIHPTFSKEIKALFLESIHKNTVFDKEYPFIRPSDGKLIYLRGYGKTFLNENGKEPRFIGSVQDITEAKLKEIELIKAKKTAEDASKVKEEFLSVMSHEIRTPLNAVIGMAHLLLEDNPKPSQIENLKTLKFSADNLLFLVNDILDFSKIEAGKISFEEIDFSLKELVKTIRHSHQYMVEEKHIAFDVLFDEAIPPHIIGDPVRISQILSNLVNNAIKFTNFGKVSLEVNLLKEEQDSVVLGFKVQDTGIGIAKDKQEYIFENFTQASANTTRKYGGTGLGLAITKRLLTLYKSNISLTSEIGIGSAFSFDIVFRKSNLKEPGTAKVFTPLIDLSSLRLLLVEDNSFNQLIASKFLKQWGIDPHYASNGLEALNMLEKNVYDIILMDLQMPEMDGYETARRIRQAIQPAIRNLPVIAFTASASHEIKDKVLSAGMDDFVTKPFVPNELYTKLTSYLPAGFISKTLHQPSVSISTPEEENKTTHLINFQSIVNMADGSVETEIEFISMYIEAIEQLNKQFSAAMISKDMSKLSSSIHRSLVSLNMIEATELVNLFTRAKTLLSDDQYTQQELHMIIEEGDILCNNIITELKKLLILKQASSDFTLG